jgi:hypothetical protein
MLEGSFDLIYEDKDEAANGGGLIEPMSQNLPPLLPTLLAWLLILPAMYFGLRSADRFLRRKFSWLFSPRATLVQLLLVIVGLILMTIFFPPPATLP